MRGLSDRVAIHGGRDALVETAGALGRNYVPECRQSMGNELTRDGE